MLNISLHYLCSHNHHLAPLFLPSPALISLALRPDIPFAIFPNLISFCTIPKYYLFLYYYWIFFLFALLSNIFFLYSKVLLFPSVLFENIFPLAISLIQYYQLPLQYSKMLFLCVFFLNIVSSVRSSNSHPDLLVTQHPLFQITPVLNTGLSLSEPLQLYKGHKAI